MEPSRRTMPRLVGAAAVLLAGAGGASAQTDLVRHRGAIPDDAYGWAIGPAGDVDGDGFADFLVGSDDDSTHGPAAGRIRVLSGRDGSLLREHFGDKANDRLGFGLGKSVGDLDGDGHDDYVAGAMETADLVSYGYGYVRAWSGATGALLHEWVGSELDAAWGEHPTIIGDINQDGHDDVVIGAAFANPGGVVSAGRVEIYSGADGSLLWSHDGQGVSDYFGWSFATVSDVDGDGSPELAIGLPGRFVNGVWRGGVEVWSPRQDTLLFTEMGGVGDFFGTALADVGDLDGDGTPELLVGVSNDNGPDILPGEAHVYSLLHGAELYCFAGPSDGDLFGYAVAGLDDLDGDGVNEFLISAPVGSYTQPWTGHVYIYSGRRGRLLHDLETGVQDDVFGADVMVLGDLDGDGRREWLVGAPEGKAYGVPNAPGAIHLFTSRDCHASAPEYGAGWPGTLGVPELTASSAPLLGEPIDLVLGNSYGPSTLGLVLLGFGKAQLPSSWDGDFLVAPPWIAFSFLLPSGGLTLQETIDPDATLCGLELDAQLLVADPGASDGVAFSRGLELLLGGL